MRCTQRCQLLCCISRCDFVQGAWLTPVLLHSLSQMEQQTPSAMASKLSIPRTRCQSVGMAARIWYLVDKAGCNPR